MVPECERVRRKARAKTKALLRTSPYNTIADMIRQFKTHVWPILESANVAILHAGASYLASLDAVQNSFLSTLGIPEEVAFTQYHMAPLRLRRDIGALGLLHKINLGISHPAFRQLFPQDIGGQPPAYRTRDASRLHNKLLIDRSANAHLSSVKHSLFGMVRVYNRLPQYCADATSVSEFQSYLTEMARTNCRQGNETWQQSFTCRNTHRM